MEAEIDSLRMRVEAICATGNAELIHMATLRLGRDLRAFLNKKFNRQNFKKFQSPFTQLEVDWKLSELAEVKQLR